MNEVNGSFESNVRKFTAIPGGLGKSGGPPHNEEMEHRLAQLEAFADDAKQRLVRVETKLDHIDKEVGQVKWWIVAQMVAGMLAVVGTGIAIQQMTVSTFQAAGAQAAPPSPPQTQPPIIINVPPASAAPAPQQPTH
ncbi:hypothetical protein [Delftia acidovorans]|uniref:hypothetical protein n=1 Tax=Delftia acidovorans TaxID=80866 RepID=UPI003D12CFF5